MLGRCPHCATPLPPTQDAFCPECRGSLDDPPTFTDQELGAGGTISREDLEADRIRARQGAIILSVGFYVILVASLFSNGTQRKMAEAFGPHPLSLPPAFFAAILITVLYLPAPLIFYHLSIIIEQARRDGQLLPGIIRILHYLLVADVRYPHLRRSRQICLLGLVYFVGLCFVWIAYTAIRGI